MQEDIIVTGYSQIPTGIQALKEGRVILVSPPYLDTLLFEVKKERLNVEVKDCGLFFEVCAYDKAESN